MPRCQRTLRLLDGKPDATVWQCPFCPDGERYERVTDSDLLHFGQMAFHAAVRDFGAPWDARVSTRLIRGLMPECVRNMAPRGYDLYLSAGADALQLRLQIGHEMFHRVCSQGQVFHWTHEMMACVFSVRLLRASGFADYAAQMDASYHAQAELLPLADLLTADVAFAPYPAGLYGRAYVTGDALLSLVGWAALADLVALNAAGRSRLPDFARWQSALPMGSRLQVTALLQSAGC